jgi:hypothetical protein
VTHETGDVRQVLERLRERHGEMCDETDGMESGDAEVLRLAADALEALSESSDGMARKVIELQGVIDGAIGQIEESKGGQS